MNSVGGNADVGFGVVRQYRVTAVGIAGAAREIAAGHVDLDALAGSESMVDMAEGDREPLDAIGHQMA